jgi:hypothetical protein
MAPGPAFTTERNLDAHYPQQSSRATRAASAKQRSGHLLWERPPREEQATEG